MTKYVCLCITCTKNYEWKKHRTQAELKKYYDNIRKMDEEEDERMLQKLWTGY